MKKLFAAAGLAVLLMTGVVAQSTPGTIVDVASSNSDFSTLVAAVSAADLVSTLQSVGPFTVFAPPNAAFAKLPAGTVDTLLKPANKAQLVSILTYHVVSGKVLAVGVVKTARSQRANRARRIGAHHRQRRQSQGQ